jgi:hypothetical protein
VNHFTALVNEVDIGVCIGGKKRVAFLRVLVAVNDASISIDMLF